MQPVNYLKQLSNLPPPSLIPATLTVMYADGGQIEVPYFDRDGALSFLNSQEGISGWSVEERVLCQC